MKIDVEDFAVGAVDDLPQVGLLPGEVGDPQSATRLEAFLVIGVDVRGVELVALCYQDLGKAEVTGFKMGLEYFTKGTNKIIDRDVNLIVEDTQLKAARAKMLLTKLYSDDKVDLAIGPTSSGVALAVLPVAQEFKKILIVEPAVADSITGKNWNRYIFRTGRNSSQDAISNAAAVAKPGVSIACIGQDYAFGRDGIAAYKAAAEKLGAKVVHEEYSDPKGTDFTASVQRIIEALKDLPEPKYVWIIWAGKGGPLPQLMSAGLDKYGIEITSGGNVLAALKLMKPLKLSSSRQPIGHIYVYVAHNTQRKN